MVNTRIEDTLEQIAGQYKPGLLPWLKRQPDRWARLLELEGKINAAALDKSDLALDEALSNYRTLFEEVLKVYEA